MSNSRGTIYRIYLGARLQLTKSLRNTFEYWHLIKKRLGEFDKVAHGAPAQANSRTKRRRTRRGKTFEESIETVLRKRQDCIKSRIRARIIEITKKLLLEQSFAEARPSLLVEEPSLSFQLISKAFRS
ncbi:MAG: hypothetical protein CL912_14040 [Deltaproteobacteria bacterium]|nr:hypothetical protein [Deltaproteobacteria bacterium]